MLGSPIQNKNSAINVLLAFLLDFFELKKKSYATKYSRMYQVKLFKAVFHKFYFV